MMNYSKQSKRLETPFSHSESSGVVSPKGGKKVFDKKGGVGKGTRRNFGKSSGRSKY